MLKVIDDKRLITKVCKMYYLENINQKKIAKELGLSPPTVSRLILNGRKLGIVEIKINDYIGSDYIDLERKLESALDLKEVVVVDSNEDENVQEELIAKAGAQLLETFIDGEAVVGVSMGETLARLPAYIEGENTEVTFVPLIGGLGQVELDQHSNTLAQNLAKAMGGENLHYHAPGRAEDEKTKKAFLRSSSVREVLNVARHMDIALLGIGYPNLNSRIVSTGYFTPGEVEEIIEQGAAGDICLQLFDANGSTKPFKAYNRVVGIELADLKKIATTIALAGGSAKAEAIIGAARGGFFNHLITDKKCAERILREIESEDEEKG